MNVEGARARAYGLPALALGIFLLFASACHVEQPPDREEKFVTVRLHDSLSRFDSVEVLILAGGDPNSVVGKVWAGRLPSPGAIPSFRLDDGERRDLVISVKGWDSDGRLALVETISKVDGKQVVSGTRLPQPSPRLKSLVLDTGALEPPFQPSVYEYTVAIPYARDHLRLTPDAEYSAAKIFVDINQTEAGKASEAFALEVGPNRITVTVRAADTTAQYVISANRAAKPVDTVVVPPDTIIIIPPKPDTTPKDTLRYNNWKYKGVVLLNFQQVGLQPGFKVADFPLLLRLTRDNFKFSQASGNGTDVRFATTDGKILPFELVRWDAGAQVAEIFIRTDTLEYGKTGRILMYWGNPGSSKLSAPSKVFSPDAGWGGVWHLEEDGAKDDYQDATGQNVGRGEGDIPELRDGVVGKAPEFVATNSPDWIEMPRDYDLGTEAFTMHMWIKKMGIGNYRILSKDGPEANDQRFVFDIAANTGQFTFGSNGVKLHKANVFVGLGNWMLLGLTFDGKKVHLFVDGVERESWDYLVVGSPLNKVILGAHNASGDLGFHGFIDELWTSPVNRGGDYMRLIFENQKSWSSFATLLPL